MKKLFFLVTSLAVVAFTAVMVYFFQRTNANRDARIEQANVIVYTHSSFMDSYGPGPELKRLFEQSCDCTIDYVDAGGAAVVMEKMKLDLNRRVDVILGLDHLLLSKFAQSIPVQELNRPKIPFNEKIRAFLYSRFVPYDWAPMGFVYRKSETKAYSSLAEALGSLPDKSVSLQDPSLSTPGLEFLYWLFMQSHDLNETLQKVMRVSHSFSPSWSSAYGLFKKKQTKVTFSYQTSLVYHWKEENDRDFQFMKFAEGHPAQIEYAAVPDACWNCGAAKQFVSFLLTTEAQKIIAEKNYMFPVRADIELAKEFTELEEVKIFGPERLDEFAAQQADVVDLWRKVRR